jgi:hypothetical protein
LTAARTAFFAGDFFAATFLTAAFTAFLAGDFFAAAFRAGAFFAAAFLAGAFLAGAVIAVASSAGVNEFASVAIKWTMLHVQPSTRHAALVARERSRMHARHATSTLLGCSNTLMN